MINTAEQYQISGLGSITTPDAFIPWRGVKVSGIVLFLIVNDIVKFGGKQMISTRIKDVDMVFETTPSIFSPSSIDDGTLVMLSVIDFYHLIKCWI